MTFFINLIISILVVFCMATAAYHYYPGYLPPSDGARVLLFLASLLVIAVAEALVNQAGLFATVPKTERLFFIAVGCCCAALAVLHYLEGLKPH